MLSEAWSKGDRIFMSHDGLDSGPLLHEENKAGISTRIASKRELLLKYMSNQIEADRKW